MGHKDLTPADQHNLFVCLADGTLGNHVRENALCVVTDTIREEKAMSSVRLNKENHEGRRVIAQALKSVECFVIHDAYMLDVHEVSDCGAKVQRSDGGEIVSVPLDTFLILAAQMPMQRRLL